MATWARHGRLPIIQSGATSYASTLTLYDSLTGAAVTPDAGGTYTLRRDGVTVATAATGVSGTTATASVSGLAVTPGRYVETWEVTHTSGVALEGPVVRTLLVMDGWPYPTVGPADLLTYDSALSSLPPLETTWGRWVEQAQRLCVARLATSSRAPSVALVGADRLADVMLYTSLRLALAYYASRRDEVQIREALDRYTRMEADAWSRLTVDWDADGDGSADLRSSPAVDGVMAPFGIGPR